MQFKITAAQENYLAGGAVAGIVLGRCIFAYCFFFLKMGY